MGLTRPEILLAENATGGLRDEPLPRRRCAACDSGLHDFDGFFDIYGELFCAECAYRMFYRIFPN